jgi:FecR protein
MLRRSVFSGALRTGFALVLAAGLIAGVLPRTTQAADSTKQLQRLKGDIGWATQADAGDYKQVFGKFLLPDDDYAVTRAKSAAQIAMPDSSLIELGESTSVKVGVFDNTTASPGATITLNDGSRLRFEIKRPQGGVANYHFVTPTSQVAVRGTVGLISLINNVTTVGCLACEADSVVVQVGPQTFALATGQFLAVSALGAVTTGALSVVTGAFAGAGVSVAPSAAGAAGAAGGAAAGAAAGAIVPVAAWAAAAAAVGIAVSSHPSPTPQPTNNPTSTPAPNVTPTGTVNLTGNKQAPAPAAVTRAPAAAPAPAQPAAAPGRFGR